MKVFIQMMSIDSADLYFLFNQAHQPAVEIEGIIYTYTELKHLLQAIPALSNSLYLEKLAQIANFLAKGLEFQYIEDINRFKENYWQQIEEEQLDMTNECSCLRDYGIYDLSVMHPPYLKSNKLIFFVKHDYLSIPYQASLIYPIHENPCPMFYELLPLLSRSLK